MALYACPNCKDEDNLLVSIDTVELLLQTQGDEFETELVDSDHWWDENSYMTCRLCHWEGCTNDALKSNFKSEFQERNQNGSSS